MSEIKVSSEVQNSGGMPAMAAGSSFPASLPPYGLFLNTSDNTIYYWNGASWVATGAAGSVPPIKNVLAVGNDGADGQTINLFVDTTHNASYQGNQIAYYNGLGNSVIIKATAITGNITQLFSPLTGTILVDANFEKVGIALSSGVGTFTDSRILPSSVCLPVHSGTISGQVGTLNVTTTFGSLTVKSYKSTGAIETGDSNSTICLIYF